MWLFDLVTKKLYRVVDVFTWILASSLCLLVGFQILNRFILHIPAPWSEEFCRYNFVWLTMIASARAMHDRSHISVEILPIIFAKKERISKTVSLITLLLVNFFLAVMVVQTVRFCINSIGTNCTTVRIPILYVYLILPVGFSLMLWFEIKNLVEDAIFVFAGKLAGGKGA